MNLKEIEVRDIDGKKYKLEFDYKGLANYIFEKTKDIGELELARELYKKGEIEVDKEKAIALKAYIDEAFVAVVKESLFPKLDQIINQ
mgnify:FL=1